MKFPGGGYDDIEGEEDDLQDDERLANGDILGRREEWTNGRPPWFKTSRQLVMTGSESNINNKNNQQIRLDYSNVLKKLLLLQQQL